MVKCQLDFVNITVPEPVLHPGWGTDAAVTLTDCPCATRGRKQGNADGSLTSRPGDRPWSRPAGLVARPSRSVQTSKGCQRSTVVRSCLTCGLSDSDRIHVGRRTRTGRSCLGQGLELLCIKKVTPNESQARLPTKLMPVWMCRRGEGGIHSKNLQNRIHIRYIHCLYLDIHVYNCWM